MTEHNTDKPLAYNLGKVFATMQHIINTQSGDREWYASKCGGIHTLCQSPLIEIANMHRKVMTALRAIKSRSAILAEKFNIALAEVMSLLPTDIPRYLTPDEQFNFQLGYFHQAKLMDDAHFETAC